MHICSVWSSCPAGPDVITFEVGYSRGTNTTHDTISESVINVVRADSGYAQYLMI